MRPTVTTPDAAAAAELSQLSNDSWHILGIATATEHSALIDAASATEHSQLSGNLGSDGPGHRVVSIGSVKIRHDASNEPVTRAMELCSMKLTADSTCTLPTKRLWTTAAVLLQSKRMLLWVGLRATYSSTSTAGLAP